MNAEIWQPASFMKPMGPSPDGGPQALGNIYEMRTYTYQPGSMPELLRRWAEALPYPRGVLPSGRRHVHRVRRTEQVDAHLAVQGPQSPRRGPRGRQQDPPVAQRGPRPRLPGKTRSWSPPSSPPCTDHWRLTERVLNVAGGRHGPSALTVSRQSPAHAGDGLLHTALLPGRRRAKGRRSGVAAEVGAGCTGSVGAPEPGVQHVSQGVAQEVESEDCQDYGDTGEHQ